MSTASTSLLLRAGFLLFGLAGSSALYAQANLFFPPVATDRPELSYTDSNGDGIDGMRFGPIFVSRVYGDDQNTGEIDSPLKTLGVALCVAEALGGRPVYVERGPYVESIVPFPNTEMFGAYGDFAPNSTNWPRSSSINSNISFEARCPVYVPNIGSRFVLEKFSVFASGINPRPAMYLVDPVGGQVSLVGSAIVQDGKAADGTNGAIGANGGIGLDGASGGTGTSGVVLTNVSGGAGGAGAKFSGANPRNGGNGGGGGYADSGGFYRGFNGENGGGSGGARGTGGNPGSTSTSNAQNGTAGANGADAPPGNDGVASSAIFGGNGTDGTNAAPGNGGGGGGGGGSFNISSIQLLSGGGGGGGGAGGGEGRGGRGGTAGSPIFGLVWVNTASSTLDLTAGGVSVTRGGTGGHGGSGGFGGLGGKGGSGGLGVTDFLTGRSSGRGGAGGSGSPGGIGGGGAGGRGGASIGIIAPSLASGQIQGGSISFPNGAAPGGLGSYNGFDFGFNPGASGALLSTYVGTNYPNIHAGVPAETPRLLASAARAKTAVGAPVTFRPTVMLRNVGSPEFFLLTVRQSSGYRGTFSVGNDTLNIPQITYTPNAFVLGSPNYEEPFLYDIEEPLYNAQGNFIGYDLTTWKGIVSVCREAQINVLLRDWTGPNADSNVMATLVEPAATGQFGFSASIPIVNGFSSGNFLVPNASMPLRLKYGHWLSQVVAPVARGNTLRYTFNLTNGDCDGDNEITILDYIDLSAAYGTTSGMPGWNPNADLDGDGEVTILDYLILSGNFGSVGD